MFFVVFTILFALATVVLGIAFGINGLIISGLIGGSLWFGLAIGVIFSWQSLTLFEDHLLFGSLGGKHAISYSDIYEAEVVRRLGRKTPPLLSLYVYHSSVGKSPQRINLKLFAAKDRAVLLNVIKEFSPEVRLTGEAEKIRMHARNRNGRPNAPKVSG